MKSIKIIGIAVATLGVAASIGGAIALYTKSASNLQFTIGAGTHTDTTGSVSYLINDENSPTVQPQYLMAEDVPTTGFNSSVKQAKYSFKLGATYTGVASPMYTAGNISISLTNISESLLDHLKVWATIEGYSADTLGKYKYEKMLMTSDYWITSEVTEYNASIDVGVATNGVQTLVIYLKFDEAVVNDANLYTLDEGAFDGYSLEVSWGKPSNLFDAAYIVNNKTAFEEDDAFMMAPNIGQNGYKGNEQYHSSDPDNNYEGQWQWVGAITGVADSITAAKCRQNDIWSYGSDFTLEAGKTYDVFWDGQGGEGHTASFDKRS